MMNPNTVRKTLCEMKKFSDWLGSYDEYRAVEEIPASELDEYMARFFLTAKKQSGEEYEPESLKSFQASINRYLGEKGINLNVVSGEEFRYSRDVLANKKRLLRQEGKGNKRNRGEPFTQEELNLLYERNHLGAANPKSLINTMFVNNTIHFGIRARNEHAYLRWGDIELKTSSTGEEYLEHTGRATKARNGNTNDNRVFPAKIIYADADNPQCPVETYKMYRDRRPQESMDDNSRFYLAASRHASERDVWFVNQPIGKNTFGCLMKSMCEQAGITGKKLNYCVGKTDTTSLVHDDELEPQEPQYSPPMSFSQEVTKESLQMITSYENVVVPQKPRDQSILYVCSLTGFKSIWVI